MAESNRWFDLDMAIMDDAALVVLAKECEYRPARDELLVRYANQRDRLIDWLASSTDFRSADVDDARQNAVFWTVEAIEKYDTEQIGKQQGCSFHTFLHRVLVCRFKDYAKHVRRRERHYDRSADSQERDTPRTPPDLRPDDPAAIVELEESQTRLYAALAQMDSESCRMWELLVEGSSLRDISAQLAISYDAVKRRRRKLIHHLKSRLALHNEVITKSRTR